MHQSKPLLSILVTFAVALASGQSHATTFSVLLDFNGTNGSLPESSLTLSADGSTLYGTTVFGGASYVYGGARGDGTAFAIPVSGGTPTTLFSFDGTNGQFPGGSLTLSGSTLYGVTSGGGANGYGTVFSIPVSGGTPTVLASFNGTNGDDPLSSLTLSADGSTLYGTTQIGGVNGEGTIFSVPVTGGTPTTLLNFSGTDGAYPYGGLTLSGSTLYGTTIQGGAGQGNIFSINVNGTGYQNLFSFNGTNGESPAGGLTLSADGSTLYGMASNAGALGEGTIFSIPVGGGTLTTLLNFNGADGATPNGGLTLTGSTLYGMTTQGGANNDGTVFSIPVGGGVPTNLFSFNGTNGESPVGGLTLSGSTLYGITTAGGANNDGNIFALTLPSPEPSSVILLGLGALGLVATTLRRRMRKRATAAQ